MRNAQIEKWALSVIDRVVANQPHEDARVELKAEWIPAQKAARQIAGHANSARGDPILWLIGVDQDRGVTGANHNELANWYSQVASEFNGLAPRMIDLNVPYEREMVMALLFETDRAPFVIKNPQYGAGGVRIAYEVPWREGTSTRTADRSDLIRLLVPMLNLPEVEILDAVLKLRKRDKNLWSLRVNFYVIPQMEYPLVIPFHRCEASVNFPSSLGRLDLGNMNLRPPSKPIAGSSMRVVGWESDSHTVSSTHNQIIVQGPGVVILSAEAWTDHPTGMDSEVVGMQAKLFPPYANHPVVLSESMSWQASDEADVLAQWIV
jgi:hypothetical protein